MWIPLVLSILPKTLLKWATPQSKSSIKFKTKIINNKKNKIKCYKNKNKSKYNNKCIKTKKSVYTTTIKTTTTATTTTTTTYSGVPIKQYFYYLLNYTAFALKLFVIPIYPYVLLHLFVDQFLLRTVIIILTFLMNDFRLKFFYRLTTTISSNSTLTPITTKTLLLKILPETATTAITTIKAIVENYYNSNNNSNHRTYNNSIKSKKVFLYNIPRDPHLRIINQTNLLNKQQQDSNVCKLNESELKITEDLCNYGELIGGEYHINNCESLKYLTISKNNESKYNLNIYKTYKRFFKNTCDNLSVPVVSDIKEILELSLLRNFKRIQNWIVLNKETFAVRIIM